ncbi:MAG: PRC-barrel domain-containing protein, partial [Alphaproteobacteria bacterium]|nr:PRC-barrel domain-containing protein [Alphaproteobacteria bacterium]
PGPATPPEGQAATPTTPPEGQAATPITPLDGQAATPQAGVTPEQIANAAELIGKRVVGPGGERLGEIEDVLVDDSGKPQAAIIERGGFLGIGAKQIAIAWPELSLSDDQQNVVVNMTEDQIAQAPEYEQEEGRRSIREQPAEGGGQAGGGGGPAGGAGGGGQ